MNEVMSLEYRPATIDDLGHIIDMRLAFLADIYGELSAEITCSLLNQLPGYFKRHMGKDFFAYLALEDGRPVSAVYLVVTEKPANLSCITGKTAILLNVYTCPAYRKHGLAGKLLKMAIEHAHKLNVSSIELQATELGLPVYEKLGFQCKQSRYTGMEYRFDKASDSSAANP